jgi:hypothetical protein
MNAIFNYDYALLYSAILTPFKNEDFGPTLATILLVLALTVLVGFLCFAIPQAIRLRLALSKIRTEDDLEDEQTKRANFIANYRTIDEALVKNRCVSRSWIEFRKNLIHHRDSQRALILCPTPAQAFFNPRTLRIQYEFVRSIPNFFVGLGLLGTFIGLIAALTFATQDLTRAVDQEQIKQALKGLLTTAAAKFYISAAGLVSFIVLSFVLRLSFKHLQGLAQTISHALDERVVFLTPLSVSNRQLSIQQASLEELKLFNTNIAMKIGDAVRTAVEVSNTNLTSKLSEIADVFRKLVDASRDGAGNAVNDAMKGALEVTLHRANDALEGVAGSLLELPARLSAVTTSIENVGHSASEQQRQLAEVMKGSVETMLRDIGGQVSTNIQQGTQGFVGDLRDMGTAFGESAVKIGAFLERFGSSGDAYITSLSSLAAESNTLQGRLAVISGELNTASQGVARASSALDGNLSKTLASLEEFTRASQGTNRTIRDSQEIIGRAVSDLRETMSTHVNRFNEVDEKLARIFGSITSHLEQQTRQMSESLAQMDQALAGAVNHFEQLIEDLTNGQNRRAAE